MIAFFSLIGAAICIIMVIDAYLYRDFVMIPVWSVLFLAMFHFLGVF